jgi:hypothetical protein
LGIKHKPHVSLAALDNAFIDIYIYIYIILETTNPSTNSITRYGDPFLGRYIYICMYVFMYVCMYVCMYVYICMINIYMYIYTYRHWCIWKPMSVCLLPRIRPREKLSLRNMRSRCPSAISHALSIRRPSKPCRTRNTVRSVAGSVSGSRDFIRMNDA